MPDRIAIELYIGPAVPMPVSRDILDALVSVKVTRGNDEAGLFELEFALDTRSPTQTLFLLSGGAGIPIVRVVVAVRIGGTRDILIDGVMTHHESGAGSRPGTSSLTIIGEDLTRVMDLVDFSGILYPAMPDFARVNLILAKYAFLGIIPAVVPSVLIDIPIPTSRIPTQIGKDLGYIRSLAEKVGYVFRMEPGPEVGMSTAYWGPAIALGNEQPALSLDFDGATNVEDLRFTYDASKAVLPIVWLHNQETKAPIPIPIPDITPLSPPLGAVPPIPLRFEHVTETAKLGPLQGVMIGMAKAAQASGKVVKGTGSLDVATYGRLLQPNRLVGVRGAGTAYDGLHHVDAVTTSIRRGEIRQEFELSRKGLVATVDRVAA